MLPAYLGLVRDDLNQGVGGPQIEMSFRRDRQDVTAKELDVGQDVVVFVHGLMSDERIWLLRRGLGTRMQSLRGPTQLYVRFHTGRHISTNGKALSSLLQELCAAHPQIQRLILIGHSMGGLVIRSAGYYATKLEHTWQAKLQDVLLLGTPAAGADLEKVGHLTSWILRKIPNLHTHLVARAIDLRSDGIKDLRLGLMVDEDWQHERSDALLFNLRTQVDPLPGVRYFLFLGTLAEDVDSIVALYFGDGLVSQFSGRGRAVFGKQDPMSAVGSYRVFAKTGHLELVFSQEVFVAVREALGYLWEKGRG